jgi:putative ABC transport system substrate-binding protein
LTTRRQLLFALPLLGAALRSGAQLPKAAAKKRIGLLYEVAATETEEFEKGFWDEMRRRGWSVDKNVAVERAHAHGDSALLARLAEDLKSKRVDVILAGGNSASVVAARATQTIPIVFLETAWPLERGLIDSYARPGRNVTGTAFSTGVEATTKRLDYLRQLVPSATRVSWTASPAFFSLETVSGSPYDMAGVFEEAGAKSGFRSRFHPVPDWGNLDRLFEEIIASSAQALVPIVVPQSAIARYVALALRHRLPSAFYLRQHAQAGGLLAYGQPESDEIVTAIRAADYVDRILRGAKPEVIPVYRPDRYQLVINGNTAKTLGIAIPRSLGSLAEVI